MKDALAMPVEIPEPPEGCKRLLVCGGRGLSDWTLVANAIDAIPGETGIPIETIIQGGASGADALARRFAYIADIECLTFNADWELHGKAAGPLRNQRMIDEGRPDFVLAFPGGRGTADMVRRARAAKIVVREIEP